MAEQYTGRPLVIIMQGGATRAAFGAGVLYEFARNNIYPHTISSLSAGIPTAAYYVAGQSEEMRAVYTGGIGKDLISLTNILLGKPVYDIHHLLHNVMRIQHPLSIDAIAESKTRLVIPLYNYHEGRARLFSNHDESFRDDAWSLLHVSLIVHADHILYGTKFEHYVDGALDPFVSFKESIVPENARVIVIWNESDFGMHFIKYLGHKIFAPLQLRTAPHAVRKIFKEREGILEAGQKAYKDFCARWQPHVIIPESRSLLEGFDILRNDRAHLARLFEHGREKARTTLQSGVLRDWEPRATPIHNVVREVSH